LVSTLNVDFGPVGAVEPLGDGEVEVIPAPALYLFRPV
jgi:hypothetical protein